MAPKKQSLDLKKEMKNSTDKVSQLAAELTYRTSKLAQQIDDQDERIQELEKLLGKKQEKKRG